MFDRFDSDERLANVRMSPDEICQLAALNLTRIHEAAAVYLGENSDVEASMAVLNMTALLCFPATYGRNRAEAIQMVEEILDLLPKA